MVELIVVTAIIGVLTFQVVYSVRDFMDRTKTSRAAVEIRAMEKDIFSFNTEKGRYPDSEPEFRALPGMGALKDPWGNDYVYVWPPVRVAYGPPINTDFDLYSKGLNIVADPVSIVDPISEDDVIRANDGSFVGTAKFFGTIPP
jgi:type II secretory pathway pseudopilin PulG